MTTAGFGTRLRNLSGHPGVTHRSRRDSSSSRSTSTRALLTTVDQVFSSVSNFLVGVVVARIAGPAGLGGFSLAYACWLVVAGLHRSLVTDPMAIENDADHPEAAAKLQKGLAGELTIAVAAAGVLLLAGVALLLGGQRAFGLGLVSVAPWLPFLVLQDFWRWMGFMQRKPGKALANDTVFNVAFGVCVLAVYLAGSRSLVFVIGSWGFGAFAGSVFGLWQFSARPTFRGGLSGLRSRWHMSKWLAGNSLTSWGSTQASTIIVGIILGPVGLGGLRAAQTLVYGPTLVLFAAGGSIGLPEASRAFGERGWPGLRKVGLVVTVAGFASVALVAVIVITMGSTLLRIAYGPEFAKYWPAADLTVIATIIAVFGLGSILVLKASRQTRLLFRVQVISLTVSVAAVSVLAVVFGVWGAAAATIPWAVANLSALLWYQHVAHKNDLEAHLGEITVHESERYRGPELPVEMEPG